MTLAPVRLSEAADSMAKVSTPERRRTSGPCAIEGCVDEALHRGLCSHHYHRWRKRGNALAGGARKGQPCSVDGCTAPGPMRRGMCKTHYQAWWNVHRPRCSVDGCERGVQGRGLCARHRQRLVKYGAPTAGPAFRRQRGEGLPRWAYWQRRDEQRLAADAELLSYVAILQRDPCCYCGASMEHIDHIIPINAGGSLTVDNVTAACASCNHRKSSTPLLLFLRGQKGGDAE